MRRRLEDFVTPPASRKGGDAQDRGRSMSPLCKSESTSTQSPGEAGVCCMPSVYLNGKRSEANVRSIAFLVDQSNVYERKDRSLELESDTQDSV